MRIESDDNKPINPLLRPLLHGWNRIRLYENAQKYSIIYRTPCGRSIRSTRELDFYLSITNSNLTIDLFTFSDFVRLDREFKLDQNEIKMCIDDISYGLEKTAISCVNTIDTEPPPSNWQYSARVVPLQNVPLITSQDLLEGCGCEDGKCDENAENCACWHKTYEAAMLFNEDFSCHANEFNLGYKYRRLKKRIKHSGIFECNAKCKCDPSRCSNRVVQNGGSIQVRLQLFKTNEKGWGVRCLDDIARGTFICIYAAHLITDAEANRRGQTLGDEYFAELDWVDCLRKRMLGKIRRILNLNEI